MINKSATMAYFHRNMFNQEVGQTELGIPHPYTRKYDDFKHYTATGVIYATDKGGNKVKGVPSQYVNTSGVVRDGKEVLGHILGQSEELRRCDKVSFILY